MEGNQYDLDQVYADLQKVNNSRSKVPTTLNATQDVLRLTFALEFIEESLIEDSPTSKIIKITATPTTPTTPAMPAAFNETAQTLPLAFGTDAKAFARALLTEITRYRLLGLLEADVQNTQGTLSSQKHAAEYHKLDGIHRTLLNVQEAPWKWLERAKEVGIAIFMGRLLKAMVVFFAWPLVAFAGLASTFVRQLYYTFTGEDVFSAVRNNYPGVNFFFAEYFDPYNLGEQASQYFPALKQADRTYTAARLGYLLLNFAVAIPQIIVNGLLLPIEWALGKSSWTIAAQRYFNHAKDFLVGLLSLPLVFVYQLANAVYQKGKEFLSLSDDPVLKKLNEFLGVNFDQLPADNSIQASFQVVAILLIKLIEAYFLLVPRILSQAITHTLQAILPPLDAVDTATRQKVWGYVETGLTVIFVALIAFFTVAGIGAVAEVAFFADAAHALKTFFNGILFQGIASAIKGLWTGAVQPLLLSVFQGSGFTKPLMATIDFLSNIPPVQNVAKIIGITIGTVVGALGAAVGGTVYYSKKQKDTNPIPFDAVNTAPALRKIMHENTNKPIPTTVEQIKESLKQQAKPSSSESDASSNLGVGSPLGSSKNA